MTIRVVVEYDTEEEKEIAALIAIQADCGVDYFEFHLNQSVVRLDAQISDEISKMRNDIDDKFCCTSKETDEYADETFIEISIRKTI